jgi:hypothetical protein
MAEVTTQRTLPAEFIEALGKLYGEELTSAIGGLKGLDVNKLYGPQYVAGKSGFQTQAESLAGGLGGYQQYLDAARGATGPDAYKQYMSPYQQDVINTTLQNYDLQAQKGIQGNSAQAIAAGAFGGGREGVERANYGALSDMNRAGINANLLQQGFSTANQLANNYYNQQMGLAGQSQGLLSQQIAGLSALGQQDQAQRQAELEAQKQLEYQKIYQPLQTAQQFGSGVMGLISGYPQQTQQTIAPSPTGLQTGLGALATLGGLYKSFNPTPFNLNISDRRAKENISLIGKSPSGLNIYKFKYLNGNNYYQGVMAQEVPYASILGEDGFYKVDYSKVDVEFKKIN